MHYKNDSNQYRPEYRLSVTLDITRDVMGGIDLDPATHPTARKRQPAAAEFCESDV